MQRGLDHLLRGALGVAAGLGAQRHTTTTPVRGADRTGPGTTGALLAPRLCATTGDLGTGPGALGARATGGELGGDDLVHEGHVGLDAEHGILELDAASLGTGHIDHVDGCHQF